MRFNVNKILILGGAVLLVSCSGYNKLLKSSDYEQKYRVGLKYYDEGKYYKAQTLFEDVAHYFTGTDRGDSVAYYVGASYYKQGDFVMSGEKFDEFRRRFGRSAFLEDVEYMYAKGFYYSSPAPNRDQATTRQALIAISEYLSRYPNSAKKEILFENTEELKQKLYDKAFINAKVYYNIGYYNSAVVSLKNAIDEYPESNHKEELSYLIVKSHYLFAKNSIAELQRERFMNMQDAYYSFAADYPDSKYKKELDKMQEYAKKYLARFDRTDGQAEGSEAAAEEPQSDRKAKKEEKKYDDVKTEDLKIEEQKAGKSKGERLENPKQKNKIENKNIDNGNQEK